MPSPCTEFGADERRQLLALARAAIANACGGEPLPRPDWRELSAGLQAERAVFVTLTREGRLRGCIGSLTATQPLAEAVVHNAVSAALRDPRFPPLSSAELPVVQIGISVLSPLEPIPAGSRAALAAALRPSVDGLLLETTIHRATFLPTVWEQLPDVEQFLAHLLRKAGLAPDAWPQDLRAHRYTTESFQDAHAGH